MPTAEKDAAASDQALALTNSLSRQRTGVSMRDPHLVQCVDADPAEIDVERLDPILEHDTRFPERTNVEFVAAGDAGLSVRVWERGVGETMACGTGACASLVAAHIAGLAPTHAEVRFPGGSLDIDWRKDDGGHVFMTGGVERSFEGVLDAEWLRR